jgi:hypothetical protein
LSIGITKIPKALADHGEERWADAVAADLRSGIGKDQRINP